MVDHAGAIAVKASAVGPDFSKAKLEKRLGVFVPHDASQTASRSSPPAVVESKSTYQKNPASGTSQLYQQYLTEKETAWSARKEQLAAVRDEQKRIMRRIAKTAEQDLPRAAPFHLKRLLRLQARNSANAAMADVRRSMARRRVEIKTRHKPLGYIEWLKREAERGSIPAIYALRRRGAVAPALVNITAHDLRNVRLVAGKIVHVTGRGTLFYRAGGDIFRDNGSHLSMKKEVSDQGVKAALMIAAAKFNGQALVFNGSDELKEKCVEVAAREGLSLTFADPGMERERRKRLMRDSTPTPPLQTAPEIRGNTEERGRNNPHRELPGRQPQRDEERQNTYGITR